MGPEGGPPAAEAGGRIDRIVVENFKSYKGRQTIGPFKSFTAIIGPNGSGKSNLMDAISFVLGIRTAQLRGSLRELLYSSSDLGDGDQARPRRGFVQLVFVAPSGDEVTFARVIQPSGADADAAYQSVYKIDDRTVTWDAYAARLGGFGILVKARNFLVFQVRRSAGARGARGVGCREAEGTAGAWRERGAGPCGGAARGGGGAAVQTRRPAPRSRGRGPGRGRTRAPCSHVPVQRRPHAAQRARSGPWRHAARHPRRPSPSLPLATRSAPRPHARATSRRSPAAAPRG
jgi:hypothetical protein